jgi:polyhydroxyalkanoate synthase
LRRFLGAGLDAAGWGPLQTPYSYVHSESGVSLRRYSAEGVSDGPVVLIVPAPIKAAYIWDAAPSVSVVQRSIEAECRLFMVEWARPDTCAKDIGLDDYANRLLLNCIDVIRAETGEESSFLMGHSLGGTFAAFFAALHPRRIRGLILIGAPLNFGPRRAAGPHGCRVTSCLGAHGAGARRAGLAAECLFLNGCTGQLPLVSLVGRADQRG